MRVLLRFMVDHLWQDHTPAFIFANPYVSVQHVYIRCWILFADLVSVE